ncbi:uncharacterized protein LOC134060315 [Sardina pilchardus]|uniref:uncharacterized protein LOC134060315 n=1 Tax=Sardina pilchardus TaxID=27697 RepID=UPI002E115502
MAVQILSIGFVLLLLCYPINGLPSRPNSNIEFNSDVEQSHLLLRERSSHTAFDSRHNGHTENGLLEEDSELMLVTPTSKSGPRIELRALASKEEGLSAKKKSSDSLSRFLRETVEEGSGQSEDTTTATTAAAATTTTASPITTPRYIVAMTFAMTRTYIADYNNPQTQAYQTLVASIVTWSEPIYKAKYGSRFFRVAVKSLRAVTRYRADNTEAEIDVEFDQSVPDIVPETTEVLQQLQEAASPADLSVDTSTISVLHEPKVMANVQFTTTNGTTSTVTLAAVNSTAYRDTTSRIKSELEPFFLEDYSTNFVSLNPTTYADGTVFANSYVTQSNLYFTYNATLPSATAIYNTMVRAAASGNLTINIVSVNGTAVSSGSITSRISLGTTFSLTLLAVIATQSW